MTKNFYKGVTKKPIYRGGGGGGCLKRKAWTVSRFKGSLAKKRGVMFLRAGEGVDTLMHTMVPLQQNQWRIS